MDFSRQSLPLLALPMLFTFSASARPPRTYHAQCLLPIEGTPPQAEVKLRRGESQEVYRTNNLIYRVSYGDAFGEKNVIQLVIFNTETNKQNLTAVTIDTVPKRIDMVAPEKDFPIFSCVTIRGR